MTATANRPVDLVAAAALFHALSDETRLAILEMLRDGERCVCELQTELDAAQSRLSFHLRVLKEAGLVPDLKQPVKILGEGSLSKKLIVQVVGVSSLTRKS